MKFGKKSAIVSKKILIKYTVNLCTMKKQLKTEIKSNEEKIKISFHSDKMPKEGSQCICLSVVLIDSVYRTGKNYYPQVFLEECIYVVKEKKMPEYITDNI